ncbi:hypothetical protein B0H14DRAFT_3132329 [Mycena olivaceomarginata]|nr:hypothetical protein B0H14DRAFT_3132329 [Mycena olivaceomarginata]
MYSHLRSSAATVRGSRRIFSWPYPDTRAMSIVINDIREDILLNPVAATKSYSFNPLRLLRVVEKVRFSATYIRDGYCYMNKNKSPPNKITLSAPVPHWTVLPVGVDLNPLKRRQMSGSSCTGDTSTLPPCFDVKLPTGAEAEATLTPRPWTRILKSSEDYAEGTVLKREARARSDGRAFFTGPSKASEDDIAQMLTDNASGPYRWFVQEEIPFLRNVGEWRAYLGLRGRWDRGDDLC